MKNRIPERSPSVLKFTFWALFLVLIVSLFLLGTARARAAVGDIFYEGSLQCRVLSEDLKFRVGTVSVKQHPKMILGGSLDIVPTVQNGSILYQVTQIEDKGFSGKSSLQRLILPATIQWVGEEAFKGNPLESVYFKGNAPKVGAEAFNKSALLYYNPETSGWTTPTWNGYATSIWYPDPWILEHPEDQSTHVGYVVSFSVKIYTAGTATFQWYRDGEALKGETGQSLIIFNVKMSDAGSYSVKVCNGSECVISKSAFLRVTKQVPELVWKAPSPITYGTPLSEEQLNATSKQPGEFEYYPPAGTLLPSGTHKLTVIFLPSDDENYESATATVSIVVNKAVPVLEWAVPAPITYGVPLGGGQLNATAAVAGFFAYDPAAGELLNAGTHTLTTFFKPEDDDNYEPALITTQLTVEKAAPQVKLSPPEAIIYGTALSAEIVNAWAELPGSFVYIPALGTTLNAGLHTLSVFFTPDAGDNYLNASASADLLVKKATPVIRWPLPDPIPYGAPLGAGQLNATAEIPGSFEYDPPAGTELEPGVQLLSVTFTPAEPYNYNYTTATADVKLIVEGMLEEPQLSYQFNAGKLLLLYKGGLLQESLDLIHWSVVDDSGSYEVLINSAVKRFYRVAR